MPTLPAWQFRLPLTNRTLNISVIIVLISVLFAPLKPEQSFTIYGTISDSDDFEGVSFAYVHLQELNRNVVADIDGNYEIKNVPSGEYTLSVHRLGYRTQSQKIVVKDADVQLDIELHQSILASESISVLGTQDLGGANLEHASRKIYGEDLRRNLTTTLSGSLANLPGFDERSMGGAPGRPVIRGLGDERLLILQDGIRTGDVSGQSSDHALTIDPISAQEVEIARGPAALAYGANAIAGVINVVRNQIATTVPSTTSGTLTLNGESVNRGFSGALDLSVPYNDFALTLNLSGRHAGNTYTPLGNIENTGFTTAGNAIGLSYIKKRGYIGAAFSSYLNHYGVPPIPGGHEHGVDIEMQKFQYDVKSELIFNSDLLKLLESEFSIKNYAHSEIEPGGGTGTEFGLVTTNFSTKLRHSLPASFFETGQIGISGEIQDYAVRNTGTPDANSYKIGAFIIEEAGFGNLHLEAGLRYDMVINRPKAGERLSSIGLIRERSFNALSSSFATIYSFNERLTAGASVLHSFRAPSLEELYSEGPHLATYSYETGNPDLKPERALAKELFIRYSWNKGSAQTSIFHNNFSNYLFAQNTGTPSNQNPNLFTYAFTGAKAVLYGLEFSGEIQLSNRLVIDGSLSYTEAERKVSDEERLLTGYGKSTRPLPQIPPLKGNLSLRYNKNRMEAGSRLRLAASQNRTDEFEQPTDGYSVLDFFLQYMVSQNMLMHTFTLNVNNVLNNEYYNHLSRIKELRPEAGFNISVLYRMYF